MNRGLIWISDLGLGAGLMYLLDPDRGRRRPNWQRLAQEYPHSEWARRTQIPSKS
ncbi:MAG: hypothetical protein HYS12_15805 [Planctomycetes bacterium]|nr:hypothetical protein [Planctomycetota bacterium]